MADKSNMVVFAILLCSFHYLSVSYGADSITGGESIRFGQNLTSSGGTFQLGFFTPENSNKSYVGIWYTVSKSVIVWVANRDKPLSNSSGIFTLQNDGNLVIMDGMKNLVWDTNTSSATSNNLTLHLQNNGNLVLSNSSTSILWKSFDHPTDTFLPGMEIELNQSSVNNMVFTSWRSPDDPSSGNFTMAIDPNGSVQIYIWNRGNPIWRSGQWNEQKFIGITNMRPLSLTRFRLNDDGNGRKYFAYSNSLLGLVRFVIQWDGIEHQFVWNRSSEKWESKWKQPDNECDFYNSCGNNGICNIRNSPKCSCLSGFEPKSNEEWNRGIFSGGCVRITPLKCKRNDTGKEDGFLEMKSVKLPNFAVSNNSAGASSNSCRVLCLNNCSCTGYSFDFGNGCMIWEGDLVDNNQFVDTGETLYLRLAGSELSGNNKNKNLRLIALVVPAVVLCLLLVLFLKFRTKVKVCFRRNISEKGKMGSTVGTISSDLSSTTDFVEVGKQEHTELSLYSFSIIEISTNNFSSSNKLGQGGFGPVYMGKLPGGEVVAVKRLSKTSGQGLEEFKNELILIAKLQHRNLVRLIGWCIEGDEKILIYEYMPNKSLDAYIFGKQSEVTLNWKQRFNIIEGIARGLLYLHRDSRLRIIHRDLKASNILLDEEMNPKISDFGMAKIFGGNDNQANTNRVVGTYGYMSPEYAMEGLFSIKSDVYSFGVLLLEIVSGRRNPGFDKSELSLNLIGYAWNLWTNDKAMDLVDPSIRDNCSNSEVMRCIHVGLLCVQDLAMDRPTMSSVLLMLGSEATVLPTPRQPNFSVALSSHRDVELPMGIHELFSSNMDNVSTMVPR